MGAKVQIAENRTELMRDLTIHESSFFLASMVRWVQRSSQAKNLMNLMAPRSSFKTPIRLSRAARRPLEIEMERRAKSLKGVNPRGFHPFDRQSSSELGPHCVHSKDRQYMQSNSKPTSA